MIPNMLESICTAVVLLHKSMKATELIMVLLDSKKLGK